MSTPIQPVPPLVLASEFPSLADRPAGTYNAKAKAWADTSVDMAESLHDIAVNAHSNAVAADERAVTADERASDAENAKEAAEAARDKAQEWAESDGEPAPGAKSAKGWAQYGEAQSQYWAGQSEAYRDSAAVLAAAAGAAAGLPSMVGQEGKSLVVAPGQNPGDDPVAVWGTTSRIGDVIFSAADLAGEEFIEAGNVYLQSSYPELFGLIGIKPDRPISEQGFVPPSINYLSGTTLFVIMFDRSNWFHCSRGTPVYRRTVDGGATWTTVTPNITLSGQVNSSNNAFAFDENIGIIFGSDAFVFRTIDKGLTWSPVSFPASIPEGTKRFVSSVRLSSTEAIAYCVNQTTEDVYLLKTVDAGATWTEVYRSTEGSYSQQSTLRLSADGDIVILSDMSFSSLTPYGAISTDRGDSFTPRNSLQGARAVGSSLYKVSGTGHGATLARSDDLGLTWRTYKPSPFVGASAVSGLSFSLGPVMEMSQLKGRLFAIASGGSSIWNMSNRALSSESAIIASTIPQDLTSASPAFSVQETADAVLIFSSAGTLWIRDEYNYDHATQFFVPRIEAPEGYRAFVKAKK